MPSNKYQPRSHFFVDHTNLSDPQAANIATDSFGPVAGNLNTIYCTTSVVRASASSKVFAICDGQLLIQPHTGDTSKVNLILKPTASFSPFKIKYFIYRGVDMSDLIFGPNIAAQTTDSPEFIKRIWKASSDLVQALNEPPPSNLSATFIGYDPSVTNDELLSHVFLGGGTANFNLYNIPKCFKGELIGNFSGKIGLDIVLDYGDYELDYEEQLFKLNLGYARKSEHIFDISTITGAVKQKRYREYIHQFIDAAAFWGSHIECGEITLFNDTTPKTNVNDIYGNIVSKYQTKNNLYLYTQGERGRSYNFYGNGGQVSFDEQGTSTPILVDYKAEIGTTQTDWPIVIKTMPSSSTEIKEFQFSFHYNIDASIHSSDVYLSAFCIFPNSQSENFFTTNQLLKTTPQSGVKPDIPTRNGQSKLIQNISVKSINAASNYHLVSNLLLIIVCEYQPSNFLEFYNDLWKVNIKDVFILPSGAANLSYWTSRIKTEIVHLSGINIRNVTINTKVITDSGKNSAGTIESRKLYQVVFNNTTKSSETFQINKGINSAFEENLEKSNYGVTFFDNSKCRFYKGQIDDGGTIINAIHLVNEEYYFHKRKFVQLGILTKEYNKLIYDNETVPDTSATGYTPFINDPVNIYFHLEEDTTISSAKGYKKFKLGLKYEDNTGALSTKFPTSDIFVYTIDDFTFFTKKYADHQEFYVEQPKCNVKFRVKLPYTGDFGFDWMRIGDTGAPGDLDYKNHVGRLYSDAAHSIIETDTNEYNGFFLKHEDLYKKLEFEYNPFPVQYTTGVTQYNIEKYHVPVLTIYPPYVPPTPPIPDIDRQSIFTAPYNDDTNRLAELTLKIQVALEPIKLEFEYDNAKLNILPISLPKTVGSHTLNISIECLTDFGSEQLIKLRAYYNDTSGVLDSIGKTVGVLRVNPNKKSLRYSKKILLIDVITDITGTGTPSYIFSLEEQAKFLKKFLRQALITPIIEVITIDLVANPDSTFNNNFIGTDSIGNLCLKSDNGSGLWMLDYLYDWLTTTGPSPVGTTLYADYFKAFMFHDPGDGLSGYSQPWNHYLADFPNPFPSTTTHEFLHTTNVEHTFANYEGSEYAKFTYNPLFTDNIMDYSDVFASPSIATVSVYNWQGEVAKRLKGDLDPEP